MDEVCSRLARSRLIVLHYGWPLAAVLRFPSITSISGERESGTHCDVSCPRNHVHIQSGAASSCDVVVIGGGLSGKAASLHLAKAGLKVTCIEPAATVRQAVGESLDWPSSELLRELGLPADALIKTQTATWKRHVVLKMIHGEPENYTPLPWLGGAPFHIELSTIHVDRLRLDQELQQTATNLGITMIHDKVARVETSGKRVAAVHTANGRSFSAPWYIDASGFAACILAREFNLPAIHSGPPKVAVWSYFSVSQAIEGTTLHMQPTPADYLEWVWEIPVNPDVVSVGYTRPARR